MYMYLHLLTIYSITSFLILYNIKKNKKKI